MAPPQWIHCNLCYHVMVRMERKFYHLCCRHVLCKPCMGKTDRGKVCPVCQQPLTRFTELSNQMERKEKMYFEPGVMRALSSVCQNVIFQHKQRENLIRGILRVKKALPQLKEMENALRQRIVETQRQYEKFRAYRRNLQDILRQTSPLYGGYTAIREPQRLLPTCTVTSDMATPSSIRNGEGTAGGFVPTVRNNVYPPRTNAAFADGKRYGRTQLPERSENGNDSGISDMRTPATSITSVGRPMGMSTGGPPLPMTPTVARLAHHHLAYSNQLPYTITRR